MRKLLTGAALLTLALSLGVANADHCPSSSGGATDVIIFSGNGLISNPGILGCLVDPNDPTFDTDYINPGSGQLQVRWVQASQPVRGTLTLSGIAIGSCNNSPNPPSTNPCPLKLTATAVTGGGTVWDSQVVTVNRATTAAGGTATAYVCLQVDSFNNCIDSQTHTYRTVG